MWEHPHFIVSNTPTFLGLYQPRISTNYQQQHIFACSLIPSTQHHVCQHHQRRSQWIQVSVSLKTTYPVQWWNNSENDPDTPTCRRRLGVHAKSAQIRCHVLFGISLYKDTGEIYLCSKGNLQHVYHPAEPSDDKNATQITLTRPS